MSHLIFRVHAIQRMFERRITEVDVRDVVANGEIIAEYPEELPYATRLMLGYSDKRPLHVLVMDDPQERCTVVITAYEPDPALWEPGFRRRKSP